jgi:hypothetical protein
MTTGGIFERAILVAALGRRGRCDRRLALTQRDHDDRDEDHHERRDHEPRLFLPRHLRNADC